MSIKFAFKRIQWWCYSTRYWFNSERELHHNDNVNGLFLMNLV